MELHEQRPAEVDLHQRSRLMERVFVDVRREWFGAEVHERRGAVSLLEPGGELLTCISTDAAGAEQLVAEAARKRAYVVATGLSEPSDLAQRIRRAGFRPIQRHWTYTYDQEAGSARRPPGRRGLRSLFRPRPHLPVTVRTIGVADLADWNLVCWTAFSSRSHLPDSLRDKLKAHANMGDRARWYLAEADGRAVGTACLYQGFGAAQVLAVGTLPEYRGRGVCGAVMKRVIDDWAMSGSGVLFLDTTPGGPAERIYLRLGFRLAYLRELYALTPGAGAGAPAET